MDAAVHHLSIRDRRLSGNFWALLAYISDNAPMIEDVLLSRVSTQGFSIETRTLQCLEDEGLVVRRWKYVGRYIVERFWITRKGELFLELRDGY